MGRVNAIVCPEGVKVLRNLCRTHACFDNWAASRLLTEYWRMEDEGEVVTSFDIVARLGSRPWLD